MDEYVLSQQEIDLMLHALGWSASGQIRGQRNSHIVKPGGSEDKIWDDLCKKGLAELTSGPTELFPGNSYHVTARGGQVLVLHQFKGKAQEDTIDEDADTVVVEVPAYR